MKSVYEHSTDKYRVADDKHSATHIVMDFAEYKGIKMAAREEAIEEQEEIVRNAKIQFEKSAKLKEQELAAAYHKKEQELIKKYSDREQKIAALEQRASQIVGEAKQQAVAIISQAEEKAAEERPLVEGLLRIMRENSNAKRGLTPKKQRTGYVVIDTTQITPKYELNYENWKELTGGSSHNEYKKDPERFRGLPAWKTILQTPYSMMLPLDDIKERILDELYDESKTIALDGEEYTMSIADALDIGVTVEDDEKGNLSSLLNKLYNNAAVAKRIVLKDKYGEYEYARHLNDEPIVIDPSRMIFDWKFHGNGRSGLWELHLYHTTPITMCEEFLSEPLPKKKRSS